MSDNETLRQLEGFVKPGDDVYVADPTKQRSGLMVVVDLLTFGLLSDTSKASGLGVRWFLIASADGGRLVSLADGNVTDHGAVPEMGKSQAGLMKRFLRDGYSYRLLQRLN